MAQRRKGKFGLRGFIVLVAIVLMGGGALHATGNLTNPFQYSVMLLGSSPVTEMPMANFDAEDGDVDVTVETLDSEDAGFQMVNLDDLEVEDSGFQMVDLDDLEDVSNDVQLVSETEDTDTVATSETQETMPERGEMPEQSYTLADYFNFSWDDIGGVLFNIWVMIVVTVVVIFVARPIGWLVKRYKNLEKRQTLA